MKKCTMRYAFYSTPHSVSTATLQHHNTAEQTYIASNLKQSGPTFCKDLSAIRHAPCSMLQIGVR